MNTKLVGPIFRGGWDIARSKPLETSAWCIAFVAAGVAYDYGFTNYPEGFAAFSLIYSAWAATAESGVTRNFLNSAGIKLPDNRLRVLRVFGLRILTSLSLILAAVFFIIPAAYVCAIWFVAVPVMVGENCGITESLKRSRALVGENWPSFAVFAVIIGVALFASAAAATAAEELLLANWLSLCVLIFHYIVLFASFAVAVSGYLLVRDGAHDLSEIFS